MNLARSRPVACKNPPPSESDPRQSSDARTRQDRYDHLEKLRVALFLDERSNVAIARAAGLTRYQLSAIANGYRAASPMEQEALARELKKPVEALFPAFDIEARAA